MPFGALLSLLLQALIGLAINAGLGLLQRALFPDKDPSAEQRGMRTTLQIGGDNALAFPVGKTAVAGQLVYAGTWGAAGGTPNAYLTYAIALSDLPINALTAIYVNGVRCTINFGAPVTDQGYPVSEYNYNGKDHLWVRFYDGTQTTADSLLVSKFSGDADRPWTSNHIGEGVAYVVVTALINRDLWSGFPTYLFEVEGIPLYDMRKDSTVGGSGTQRADDRSTWEYSDNPIVAIHTLFQGLGYGSQWIYGLQEPLPAPRTPYANWKAAMDEADRLITLQDLSTEKNYRIGTEVVVTKEPLDLMEQFLQASAGRLADLGGVYKILSGAPGAAVKSFTDEDLIISSSRDYRPFPPLQRVQNGITAIYPEPAEAYQNKDAPPRYSSIFEAEDDGRRLVAAVDYATVPYKYQVQRLMKAAIEEERRFRSHAVPFPAGFWQIEPLDVLSWTSAENGYVDKEFLVVAQDVLDNGNVVMFLKEIDNSDYDWDTSDQLPAPVGSVTIARPPAQPMTGWQVLPATLTDDNRTDRRPAIEVRYAALLEDVRAVRVQVRVAGATALSFDGEHPYDATVATPGNILNGTFLPDTDYEVRGIFLPFSGRETEWSGWLAVKTPNVLLGTEDIGPNAVKLAQLAQDVRDLQYWLGYNSRELIQEIENLIAGVADQDFGNFLEVHQIERTLRAELGNNAAYFTEQITAAVGPGSAIVTRIETLEAEVTALDGTVTANSSAISLLQTEVTANGANITANSNAITTLQSDLSTLDGTVSGNSTAITALQTEVSAHDGEITANANAITSLTSEVNEVSAGALFRMNTYASPGGGWSRLGFEARVSTGSAWTAAAMYLEANTNGDSRIVMQATDTVIMDSGGSLLAMFSSDLVNYALIPSIQADKINVTQLSAITADAGTVTAGLLRSSNDKMRVELNNTRIIISD